MKKKVIKPNVIRGGTAIPIKPNYYYMAGRKHEEGGIDIGKNPRTGIEVEDGEVMHLTPKEVKVFSSVPFLNGESPAKKVIDGETPTKVFKQQENYKDRKGLNDDGTKESSNSRQRKTKAMGGKYKNIRKRYPHLAGTIDGRNEATAIKALRDARNNPKYQYNGAGELPSFNMGDEIDKIPLAANSRIAIERTNVQYNSSSNNRKSETPATKKTSFNEAFGAARKAGKSIFTWNGKSYNTQLKGEKPTVKSGIKEIPEVTVTSPRIRTIERELPEVEVTGSKLLNAISNRRFKSKSVAEIANTPRKEEPTFIVHEPIRTRSVENDKAGRNAYKDANGDIIYTPNNNIVGDMLRGGIDNIKKDISGLFKRNKLGGVNNGNYTAKNNSESNFRFDSSTGKLSPIGRKKAKYGLTQYKPFDENGNFQPFFEQLMNEDKDSVRQPTTATDVAQASSARQYTPNNTSEQENRSNNTSNTDDKKKKGFAAAVDSTKKYIENNPGVVSDVSGLLSNTIGNIIGHTTNKKMLNRLKYSGQPVAHKAAKLKTTININPQLDKMRESLAAYERDVDSNTASSRVALARKQRARIAGMLQTNELYGNKENLETELINRDKLNQQGAADKNVSNYNAWAERKAAFDNAVKEKKSENTVSLIEGLNAGVQDIISRKEKRNADKNNMLVTAAAHPNVNPRILRDLGVKGITDEMIKNWDKAYGQRNSNNK